MLYFIVIILVVTFGGHLVSSLEESSNPASLGADVSNEDAQLRRQASDRFETILSPSLSLVRRGDQNRRPKFELGPPSGPSALQTFSMKSPPPPRAWPFSCTTGQQRRHPPPNVDESNRGKKAITTNCRQELGQLPNFEAGARESIQSARLEIHRNERKARVGAQKGVVQPPEPYIPPHYLSNIKHVADKSRRLFKQRVLTAHREVSHYHRDEKTLWALHGVSHYDRELRRMTEHYQRNLRGVATTAKVEGRYDDANRRIKQVMRSKARYKGNSICAKGLWAQYNLKVAQDELAECPQGHPKHETVNERVQHLTEGVRAAKKLSQTYYNHYQEVRNRFDGSDTEDEMLIG